MAATGAGDGGLLFRGVYEGSISGNHSEVDRRPYHKNCSCALHGGASRNKKCTHHNNHTKVVYPIRRCWSEGSLALHAASSAGSSPSTSPAPAPAPAVSVAGKCPSFSNRSRQHLHLDIFSEEDPDDQ